MGPSTWVPAQITHAWSPPCMYFHDPPLPLCKEISRTHPCPPSSPTILLELAHLAFTTQLNCCLFFLPTCFQPSVLLHCTFNFQWVFHEYEEHLLTTYGVPGHWGYRGEVFIHSLPHSFIFFFHFPPAYPLFLPHCLRRYYLPKGQTVWMHSWNPNYKWLAEKIKATISLLVWSVYWLLTK